MEVKACIQHIHFHNTILKQDHLIGAGKNPLPMCHLS